MSDSDIVRETFETDPISALGLPEPVSIASSASIGAALNAVQTQGQGYVLVVEEGRPKALMSESEVLLKIVARDVKYDANVLQFASPIPVTLTASQPIARAVKMMIAEGVENIPVVDAEGKATAVLRTLDVIHFLAEAFPQQMLNLPPRPDQLMPKREGG